MVMVARNTHRGELIMKTVLALPMALLLALSVPALAKSPSGVFIKDCIAFVT